MAKMERSRPIGVADDHSSPQRFVRQASRPAMTLFPDRDNIALIGR